MLRLIALRLGRQKPPRHSIQLYAKSYARQISSSSSRFNAYPAAVDHDTRQTPPSRWGQSQNRSSQSADTFQDTGNVSTRNPKWRWETGRSQTANEDVPMVRAPRIRPSPSTPKYGTSSTGRRSWRDSLDRVERPYAGEFHAESSSRSDQSRSQASRDGPRRPGGGGGGGGFGLRSASSPRQDSGMGDDRRAGRNHPDKVAHAPSRRGHMDDAPPLPIDRIVAPADESSLALTTPPQPTAEKISEENLQVIEADLDDFFAGHAEGRVAIAENIETDPRHKTAAHMAPAPLASYTPPEESGVAMVKRFMLEHKFLRTQEIWNSGTGHLKPKIQPTQVFLPDGTIRMKRVSNKREGKRVWVPPVQATFPDHPFRSVRFLKETLLYSLESAGVIHKAAVTVPLETEEEIHEAMIAAERANRKREKRAIHKGLPPPPVVLPATSRLVWGWLLGPAPAPPVVQQREPVGDQANEEESSELSEGDKAAKDTRSSWEVRMAERDQSDLALTGNSYSDEAEEEYPGYGVTSAARAERRARDSAMKKEERRGPQDVAPTFGSTDPQAELVAQFRESLENGHDAESNLQEDDRESHQDDQQFTQSSTARTNEDKFRSLEDVKAQEDWEVNDRKWQEAEKAEWEYHRARFIAAQETAERQYVRRARLREERAELARQREEDRQSGLADLLCKEKRRADAARDIEEYARATGQDVSGWYEEIYGGELGDVEPYRPTHQNHGGALGKKAREKGMRPFGFPIN